MKKISAIILSLCLIFSFGSSAIFANENTNNLSSEMQTKTPWISNFGEVVYEINQERQKLNLVPLEVDSELQYAAGIRAREVRINYSHTRLNGENGTDILPKITSECLAKGEPQTLNLVETWMNNPEDKAAMLDPNIDILALSDDYAADNSTRVVLLLGNSKAEGYVNTPEEKAKINQFVTNLYNVFLDREPDLTGLAVHTQSLLVHDYMFGAGEILNNFITSPEFLAKRYSDEEIVEKLYQGYFNRTADTTGKTFWLNNIKEGQVITSVAFGFSEAEEYVRMCSNYNLLSSYTGALEWGAVNDPFRLIKIQDFVTRLYKVFLEREPDSAGFNYHVERLQMATDDGYGSEETAADVLADFVLGPEFINSNYSNEEKVEKLYQGYFGRSADAVGKAYWMNCLDNGMPMNQVAQNFTHSQEYKDMCKYYCIKPGSL